MLRPARRAAGGALDAVGLDRAARVLAGELLRDRLGETVRVGVRSRTDLATALAERA